MDKIRKKEIRNILQNNRIGKFYYTIDDEESQSDEASVYGVYHAHDWDYGYEGNSGFRGTKREFYRDYMEMIGYLDEYLADTNVQECIISPFNRYHQFELGAQHNDIYKKLCQILRQHKIRVRQGNQSGFRISVDDDFDIIEAVIEGAFRGVSTLSIFFVETNVLLTPTHHFELFFWTIDQKKQPQIIEKLSKKYKNILYYHEE